MSQSRIHDESRIYIKSPLTNFLVSNSLGHMMAKNQVMSRTYDVDLW